MEFEHDLFARFLKSGILGIIRTTEPENVVAAVEALVEGGIDTIEISLVTPNTLELLKEIRQTLKHKVVLGAGTVLDPETARLAILAGVDFVVSPIVSVEMTIMCRRYSKMSFPGAYTPTEILKAWETGATAVKVFPAIPAGPEYIKAVLAPLPQIPLIAVGGVSLSNMQSFIDAGCVAVAGGSSLISAKLIKDNKLDEIHTNAKMWLAEMHRIQTEKKS